MADFQVFDADRRHNDNDATETETDNEIEIEITDPEWIARFDAARTRHEHDEAERRRRA